jgi:hypothetical protein
MTHTEIHLHRTTTLTPEQYVAGLTDFGLGRSKLFGNSVGGYEAVKAGGVFIGFAAAIRPCDQLEQCESRQ